MNDIKLLILYLLISLTSLSGCVSSSEKSYAKNISIKECWFSPRQNWPTSECGILTVPEDYANPAGRQVKLPFIIFKAKDHNSETYPLVVAGGGGPGSALGISALSASYFDESIWSTWYASSIAAGRDLILIDNRGVGSSTPRLSCHEVEKANMTSLDKLLDVNDAVDLTRKTFTSCKRRFTEQGIDISQYHVVNAARDLEQLRLGLGYEQLNIYGISYGSRVSLVYEKMYPNSVRALILDGIYPQASRSFVDIPKQNYEAIKRVIRKCQEHDQCMKQFGFKLEERLVQYLSKLEKNPLTISITSPEDYMPIDVIVTPDVFFDSLYEMMYDEYSTAYIPKYLYSAFRGNTDYLTEMVREYYVNGIIIDPLDVGAYASYACFDDHPFTDYQAVRREIESYPFQHYSNDYAIAVLKSMCDIWNVPGASADFKESYRIKTPVLIYSGELDPITPARLARPVIDNADIAWNMEWPNVGHGVMLVSDCADWTAATFLDDPESDPFTYECSDEPNKLEFKTR